MKSMSICLNLSKEHTVNARQSIFYDEDEFGNITKEMGFTYEIEDTTLNQTFSFSVAKTIENGERSQRYRLVIQDKEGNEYSFGGHVKNGKLRFPCSETTDRIDVNFWTGDVGHTAVVFGLTRDEMKKYFNLVQRFQNLG